MTTDASEAELRHVEEVLEQANRDVDVPTLESIMADDFFYMSGVGKGRSRDEWLDAYPRQRLTPEGKAREEKTRAQATKVGRETVLLLTGLRVGEENQYEVELHGDIAVTNKRYSIQDPDGSERCLRYVRVYNKRNGRWQLISHRYVHAVD